MRSEEYFPAIFGRHAAAYHSRLTEVMGRGEARGRQACIDWVLPAPGQRGLDLACGPGTLTLRLAEAVRPGGEVLGVDLAEGMLELAAAEARSRGLPARFQLMDMQNLHLADGAFDFATCGHGMQFVPDLDAALREVRRVLRAGCPFAASVPSSAAGSPGMEALDRVLDSIAGPAPPGPDDRARTREVVGDGDAWAGAAREAGFEHAEARTYDEEVTWPSPEDLVDRSLSWWSVAVRVEHLSPETFARFRQEALAEVRRASGEGPIMTPGRTLVLLARA